MSNMRKVPWFLSLVMTVAVASCGSSKAPGGGAGGAVMATGGSGAGATPTGGSGGGQATGGAGDAGVGGADGGAAGKLTNYQPCSEESRIGRFTFEIKNDPDRPYSAVDGFINDRTSAVAVKKLATVDGCSIYQPAEAACTPECGSGTICVNAACVPEPKPRALGRITITGAKTPIELVELMNRYANGPMLTHPAFAPGADLRLVIEGAAGFAPLTLKGVGVDPLVASKTAVVVESGKPAILAWTAPAQAGPGKVHVRFGVNLHGDVDTWFECDVPDSGSFTASAALMTELYKHGFSGFPTYELTRRTVDSANVGGGCVEFVVSAPVTRALKTAGFDDCNEDQPCPAGKTCGDDLLCR